MSPAILHRSFLGASVFSVLTLSLPFTIPFQPNSYDQRGKEVDSSFHIVLRYLVPWKIYGYLVLSSCSIFFRRVYVQHSRGSLQGEGVKVYVDAWAWMISHGCWLGWLAGIEGRILFTMGGSFGIGGITEKFFFCGVCSFA